MAAGRLISERHKMILKCYWKLVNVCELQSRSQLEFEREPPTRIAIGRIRDKYEAEGTMHNPASSA